MRIRIVTLIVVVLIMLTPSLSSADGGRILKQPHISILAIKDTPVLYRTPQVYILKLQAFYAAIIAQEWRYIEAVSAAIDAEKAAIANEVMPAEWVATATCEEGGRNDPYAGYFGILEWNGFHGYPTAGSAPLSEQLAWEATYIGGPPDAPGQCHSY